MTYVKYNIAEEREKAVQGKKTKTNVAMLIYLSLDDYPAIQKQVARHFGIS
jgi:hypothetical protein